MKKVLFLIVSLFVTVNVFSQQKQTIDYGLPVLHVVKEVSLSPSYSCRSTEDFRKGYEGTALFVSDYSKKRNAPDLVFNGACGLEDYFQASTAGNDMALIADLGENVSIESLSAHKTFNLQNVHDFSAYSKFSDRVEVVRDHTYAVLLNKSYLRGLILFSVEDYEKNKKVTLKYAVKMYEIFPNSVRAEGFNWEKENTENRSGAKI